MDYNEIPERVSATLQRIAEQIGYMAHLTNAEWGRVFAERLVEEDESDAIQYACADAGEGYRALFLSGVRQKAKSASRRLVRDDLTDEEIARQLELQLNFVINPPNCGGPLHMLEASNEYIVTDYLAELKRIAGQMHSLMIRKRAIEATMPFPGIPIYELLEQGLITYADLLVTNVAASVEADLLAELRLREIG